MLMHFDVNNGMIVVMKVITESGEDEEITHFVGSKNIGAAHKKTTTKITWNKHALIFGKTVQVYIRLLFGWIKRQLLWI